MQKTPRAATMNPVLVLNYLDDFSANFGKIRRVTAGEKFWYVARDLFDQLGIQVARYNEVLSLFPKEQYTVLPVRGVDMTVVSPDIAFTLITTSKNKKVAEFCHSASANMLGSLFSPSVKSKSSESLQTQSLQNEKQELEKQNRISAYTLEYVQTELDALRDEVSAAIDAVSAVKNQMEKAINDFGNIQKKLAALTVKVDAQLSKE